MELYEGIKIKRLEWTEDLVYLSNTYCPFCGYNFRLDDKVVEISTDPVVVVYNNKKADKLLIAVHLKCLLKAIEEGE